MAGNAMLPQFTLHAQRSAQVPLHARSQFSAAAAGTSITHKGQAMQLHSCSLQAAETWGAAPAVKLPWSTLLLLLCSAQVDMCSNVTGITALPTTKEVNTQVGLLVKLQNSKHIQ